MKVVITVKGPLGMQEIVEHKNTNFKACVDHAIKDLQLISKHVDKTRQESWEKLEMVVER